MTEPRTPPYRDQPGRVQLDRIQVCPHGSPLGWACTGCSTVHGTGPARRATPPRWQVLCATCHLQHFVDEGSADADAEPPAPAPARVSTAARGKSLGIAGLWRGLPSGESGGAPFHDATPPSPPATQRTEAKRPPLSQPQPLALVSTRVGSRGGVVVAAKQRPVFGQPVPERKAKACCAHPEEQHRDVGCMGNRAKGKGPVAGPTCPCRAWAPL